MQYPPNNQVPFQQPNTQYPPQQPWQQPGQWQQPQYQPPPNYYPPQQPPMMPPPRPPKKQRPLLVIAIIVFIVVAIAAFASANNNTSSSTNTATTNAPTTIATPTDTPFPTATPAPTQPPTPTESPAQVERLYKAQTKNTTVENLDRDGNADTAKDVHFICKILNFVKDDSGNTAGANCDNPNSYSSSVIQIEFPSSTDITKLNQDDIVEIWGTDEGVFSGQNAFGGTVHEVGVNALYMTDTTTGYYTS